MSDAMFEAAMRMSQYLEIMGDESGLPSRGQYDAGTDATLAALLPVTCAARRDTRSGGMTSASAVYGGIKLTGHRL